MNDYEQFEALVEEGAAGRPAARAAYGRAVGQFLAVVRGAGPGAPGGRAAARGGLRRTHPGSAPTVKQHLAAIRMLGDWLVDSQVVLPAGTLRRPVPEGRRTW